MVQPNQSQSNYPQSLDTSAKRALYDNFGKDEVLANKIDTAIRYTKKADWVGDRFKEREIAMVFDPTEFFPLGNFAAVIVFQLCHVLPELTLPRLRPFFPGTLAPASQ